MARMKAMRHLGGMGRGNYSYSMPEEEREVVSEPDLSDDEDGYPWDADRGGSLGDDDDESEGEEGE